MSKWRSEITYLIRHAGTGLVTTAIGFTIIFLMLLLGTTPFIANFLGYLVGLSLGFFLSKKIVFRSNGSVVAEWVRYLTAFTVSYIFNILTLYTALELLFWNVYIAQLIAATVYTISMYILSRLFVYNIKNHNAEI